MRLPSYLLKFWIHRLKSKEFTKVKNKYFDEGQGRCAAGVLLSKNITTISWLEREWQELQITKVADIIVTARRIFVENNHTIASLNDGTSLSFKAIIRILKRNQHNHSFLVEENQLKALESLYKHAVENGEYVETT
jgi:hypothetical protein